MFEPSSQALCKVCMPESNLCVALFVRPSKERHQQGFGLFAQTFFSRALCKRFVCLNPICSLLCLCDPLREGISKAHFSLFKPHLKGSARLQGFTLRGQYFFSRALQGFSKASLAQFLSRAMQGKASTSAPLHHSINQTRYRKPTDMHPPPPNITT